MAQSPQAKDNRPSTQVGLGLVINAHELAYQACSISA